MILSKIVDKLTQIDIRQLRESEIFIFGCGQAGRLTQFALKTLQVSAAGFIDNDSTRWGKHLLDLEIYSPDELVKRQHNPNIFILIASSSYSSISIQLQVMGFKSEHYHALLNFESTTEVVDHTKTHYYKTTKVGRYTYGYKHLCEFRYIVKEIGSFCSINRTAYVGANHPIGFISSSPFFYRKKGDRWGNNNYEGILTEEQIPDYKSVTKNHPIVIGHDVWVGAYAVILPGVKIGNGAVIGAGAVVTKDVPDYAIAVGVPAKVINYRFSPEQIEKLLQIKWWDWPIEKIKENVMLFMDKEKFIDYFGQEN